MSKLKIVIVSRALPYLGGREVIVNRLIYNFLNKNIDILLITPDNYLNKKIKVIKSTLDYKSILNKVKDFNPDIINCHTFYFHDLSFKLSRDINKPLISTLHGIFISLYGKNYKKLIKKIIEESEKVVVVSNNFKKTLEKTFKIRNKIISIRNGIEKQTTNGFKLRSNKINILIPARLNKIKGIEYAIKAMKLIDNKSFSLIISSPKGRKNIKETIYKNKLKLISRGLNIRFEKNYQSDLMTRIQKVNICLLPSLSEGISLSILEAMSLGKIVITTTVGGNNEIIKNGINGFLIPSRDHIAIAKKIIEISKMSQFELNKISSRAIKTVDKNFNENRMINQYCKYFKKYHEN